MINYSDMPQDKINKVLRRRLKDLREDPGNKFIHFDIAAGMTALNVDTYHDHGQAIRKIGFGAVMLTTYTETT